ncbi:MAG TPA: DmsC/YnfH family molybdoenzyme membrane anchor subunit [Pirellulales bacterium]|jgi:Fe-S-cluster-containing dehydrogenase component/DMSO reductase anchor subunit|nr:DmsC/YnfH family molybdoenzyme membrane anchor subunit [Pirellulales bacterium]
MTAPPPNPNAPIDSGLLRGAGGPISGGAPANSASSGGETWSLIEAFLSPPAPQKQTETAVENFARQHARHDYAEPAQSRYYRDLIPLAAPRPGEQFAFEVDLDACSGCKACVTACHNLNGLEDDELWRSVGMLHGGTTAAPVVQHITTACHHCLEPACLIGCPVKAYEKDPVTGIVRHLDDQCIGCQYCILKCPYDVPKYSPSKGIVRKCDMCSDRLAVGEAPACVQGCPNQAIRIKVVNQQELIEQCEASLFLPGAPEPGYTLPSTIYKTARALPRNLLPADYYSVTPGHRHAALVNMLVLTQMSVGAFAVQQGLSWLGDAPEGAGKAALGNIVFALLLGMTGLLAAIFHLGRPRYAFRAMIGLRTSWLSREILAFGLFAGCATGCAVLAAADRWDIEIAPLWQTALGAGAVLFGGIGILCSVMIYADTQRPFWSGERTGPKFFWTAALLGLSASLLAAIVGASSNPQSLAQIMRAWGSNGAVLLALVAGSKMIWELAIFRHLWSKQNTALKRTALLLRGDLQRMTKRRFAAGVLGGVLLPLLLAIPPAREYSIPLVLTAAVVSFALNLMAEWWERSLFFTAVVAPKMPGVPAG